MSNELEYSVPKRVQRCWREGKGKEAKAERLRLGRATLPTTTAASKRAATFQGLESVQETVLMVKNRHRRPFCCKQRRTSTRAGKTKRGGQPSESLTTAADRATNGDTGDADYACECERRRAEVWERREGGDRFEGARGRPRGVVEVRRCPGTLPDYLSKSASIGLRLGWRRTWRCSETLALVFLDVGKGRLA